MKPLLLSGVIAIALAGSTVAQEFNCEDDTAPVPTVAAPFPQVQLDPAIKRLLRYTAVESRHRLTGLASYYSNSLDGTLTANGERYHKKRLSAAHLTLPLGSWVEITSRATGKRIRLRVNDRGPYSKFVIDLSRRAARALGVDVAEDRSVTIRIIALPGEDPLPNDIIAGPVGVASEECGW